MRKSCSERRRLFSPRIFFCEVSEIFKKSKYRVSGIAIFSFQVLSCLTPSVDVNNISIYDFTAKPFSQLIIFPPKRTVLDESCEKWDSPSLLTLTTLKIRFFGWFFLFFEFVPHITPLSSLFCLQSWLMICIILYNGGKYNARKMLLKKNWTNFWESFVSIEDFQ